MIWPIYGHELRRRRRIAAEKLCGLTDAPPAIPATSGRTGLAILAGVPVVRRNSSLDSKRVSRPIRACAVKILPFWERY